MGSFLIHLVVVAASVAAAVTALPATWGQEQDVERLLARLYASLDQPEEVRYDDKGHRVRNLDALGGGNLVRDTRGDSQGHHLFGNKRLIDSLSGVSFGTEKRGDAAPQFEARFVRHFLRADPMRTYIGMGSHNFDEIDRSGFNSFAKRNFDEIDRSGFNSFAKRNFDEIDRSGFNSFAKRNFDEIDRSGFNSFAKRNFDEIDRSGFNSFAKRNFDEIDRSGFNNFAKRNFDEIDRTGGLNFSKRSPPPHQVA